MLGYNMFAYCLNNPTNGADYTGEYTDGQIHDFVIQKIVDREDRELKYLRTDTIIVYTTAWKTMWYGFCDLYDPNTGEVWELKKNTTSYKCSTVYATTQLNNYINNGVLINDPKLVKKFPTSFIKPGLFEKIDSTGNRYVITYWDEGGGILRYQYYIVPSAATVVVIAGACVAAILTQRDVVTDEVSQK